MESSTFPHEEKGLSVTKTGVGLKQAAKKGNLCGVHFPKPMASALQRQQHARDQ
jgi:hypothetical protein